MNLDRIERKIRRVSNRTRRLLATIGLQQSAEKINAESQGYWNHAG